MVLDELDAYVRASDECVLEPELMRLRGLAIAASDPDAAAAQYLAAVERARACGTRALELRAANELARLWRSTPRAAEAAAMVERALAPIREGAACPDVVEARALRC